MFSFLKIKTNTVGKTVFLIAFFTITSTFLAIIRDKIFSTKFGAGEVLDIYIAAFKIPDLIFLTVATIISSFIIIPFLDREESRGESFVVDFISKLFFSFSLLIIFVSSIVFFIMPYIADFLFSGFEKDQLEKLVFFSRIMLLSPILMGISFVFSAINQKKGYFLPLALTGVFYNLSIISSTLFLYPFFGFKGVVFGVVFGSLLFFLLQLPPVFAEKMFPRKISFFGKDETWKILKVSLPRSIALVLADFALIFLIAQATFLGSGSVTILNFSINIFLVPISVIAVAYSVAVFPKLSKLFVEEKKDDFRDLSQSIVSRILFFGIPISLFFMFFSSDLVGFFLGSEKFGLQEINLTGFLVSVLAIGIVFQAISVMTVRIFYAMGKTWLPFIANILTGSVLVLLVLFLKSLSFSEWEKFFQPVFGKSFFLDSQSVGLFILIFSYTVAFVLGAFFTNFLFKKSIKGFKNFSLLKNTNWKNKLIISLFSMVSAKIILESFKIPEENSFGIFFLNLTIAGMSFLVFFILLSEISNNDKNYNDFKKIFLSFINRIFKKN